MTAETINTLEALSNAMAEAVEKAAASIVTVDARQRMPASGIAFSADMILTADHVVERDEDISVGLPDGNRDSAKLVGRDPGNDLVLLKLQAASLRRAEIAPAPARIGQLAMSLGRPSKEGIQASLGLVSAAGGPVHAGRGGLLEKYLRTDAIPYPGFSGGPLVNASGQVLGVNTSGLVRAVSLAIPVSLAWQVAESLSTYGSVRRGYLGVRSQPVQIPQSAQHLLERSQATGLLLVGVEEGSPAAEGGLMVGDILVGLQEAVIDDPDELLVRLAGSIVGQQATIEVIRGGQPARLSVTIKERK